MEDNPWEATGEDENRGPRRVDERDVEVAGVWEARPADGDGMEDGPVRETFVQLRDRRGRELPIFIGPFEAMSIVHGLGGDSFDCCIACHHAANYLNTEAILTRTPISSRRSSLKQRRQLVR